MSIEEEAKELVKHFVLIVDPNCFDDYVETLLPNFVPFGSIIYKGVQCAIKHCELTIELLKKFPDDHTNMEAMHQYSLLNYLKQL